MKLSARSFLFGENVRQKLWNVLFLLFLLALAFKLIRQFFTNYGFDSWQMSEFLINYQGGFVRRGLFGELLLWLVRYTGMDVEWFVKVFCMSSFVAVCIFFTRAFLKKNYALYILPLCFFLGMGILGDYWLRKDYLMILILIAVLKFCQGKWINWIKLGTINVLLVSIILTHEVFAFFSLPILLLLVWSEMKHQPIFKSISLAVLYLCPAIISFIMMLVFHGSPVIAQTIIQSWQGISHTAFSTEIGNHSPAIEALGWTGAFAFKFHLVSNFFVTDWDILSSFIWICTFPTVYYIASNYLMAFRKNEHTFTHTQKTILSAILLFQLVCLLPVFILLSCDYLRLFFYWVASSYTLFLIIPSEKLAKLIPTFVSVRIVRLNHFLAAILYPTKTVLVLLMLFIGISSSSFSMKSAIRNNMISNVLVSLSKPFVVVHKFIAR